MEKSNINTKFDDESFDYVIASNMIHHIPYPVKFFKEMLLFFDPPTVKI